MEKHGYCLRGADLGGYLVDTDMTYKQLLGNRNGQPRLVDRHDDGLATSMSGLRALSKITILSKAMLKNVRSINFSFVFIS